MIVALTFKLYSFYSFPLCYLVFVDWTRVDGLRTEPVGRAQQSHRVMSESSSTPT